LQEEVTRKMIALAIKTAKLDGKVLQAALQKLLQLYRKARDTPHRGKQTLKQLMRHGTLECIILSVNDTYMDAQEVMHMTDYSKITALYSRLSVGDEDRDGGESNSIQNQELLCRGWFLPPNTYDCGSFVVNGTAVVGKEQNNPYNRCKSTQKGADFYEIAI